jgi:hypothetical protein
MHLISSQFPGGPDKSFWTAQFTTTTSTFTKQSAVLIIVPICPACLQEGLTLLNQVQRRWVYLEPIFGRGALPSQQARFRNVDEEFRRIMAHLEVSEA